MRNALLAATAATALTLGLGTAAHAGTITAGTTEYFSISGSQGGVEVGATGSVGYTSTSTTKLVFALSLNNTSFDNPSVSNDNRIVSFGFDIGGSTVTITSGSTDLSGWKVSTSNFPGFQSVDVCVTNGQNCAGGGNGGLLAGGSLSLNLTLNGTFSSPLTLNTVAAKFQSTGPNQAGSLELGATPTPTPTPTPSPIPEPATLALLGVGLAGLGVALRRRARAAA